MTKYQELVDAVADLMQKASIGGRKFDGGIARLSQELCSIWQEDKDGTTNKGQLLESIKSLCEYKPEADEIVPESKYEEYLNKLKAAFSDYQSSKQGNPVTYSDVLNAINDMRNSSTSGLKSNCQLDNLTDDLVELYGEADKDEVDQQLLDKTKEVIDCKPKKGDLRSDCEFEEAIDNLRSVFQSYQESQKVSDVKMGKKFKSVEVVNEGEQIILPKGMTPKQAIEWIKRREQEDEREIAINEPIECYPLDGAYAQMQALKQKYGWADAVPTPSFFGPCPPVMVGVEVAPGKTTQVIWGRCEIPGVEGHISTGFAKRNGRYIYSLTGVVKQKHKEEVAALAALTRKIVQEQSLYKGKAIKVSLFKDEGEDFDPQENAPRFIDTSKTNEASIVLNTDTMDQVIDSIFVPIELTEQCRAMRIPLKRGVLLAGIYGSGKSLTATITAKKCEQNGWTFIYVDQAAHLHQAILFAKQYQPAVVFAEDIDRAVEGQERSEDIDAILNTLDGVDTKSSEILVILTTNHIEKINKAMLRPGRLDAVIQFQPPDAQSVERLIRMYGGKLVEQITDLQEVGEMLQGQIPAVVEEVVKRAKLSSLWRASIGKGSTEKLQSADLVRASRGMLAQVKLVQMPAKEDLSVADKFAQRLGREAAKAFAENGKS